MEGLKGDQKTEIYNQRLVVTVAEFPETMPLILKKDFPFKFKISDHFRPSFFIGYEKMKFKLGHFLFAQLIPRDQKLLNENKNSVFNTTKQI